MASVVMQPQPLQNVAYVWCRTRLPCHCEISNNNQLAFLALLDAVVGERSQLRDHRGRYPECRYV